VAAAEECYNQAIQFAHDPVMQARAYLEKAKMLNRVDSRDADAEAAYESALYIDPDNPFAHSAFGAFLFWRQRYAEAEDHYKRTLELRPDDDYVMASLASMLARQDGRDDEAESYFLKALRIDDSNPRTHALYANFLKWRNRFPEAETHFKRSLELKEDSKVRQQYEHMQARRAASEY
jgi:tetratricopeptide (TPR) repeat protein